MAGTDHPSSSDDNCLTLPQSETKASTHKILHPLGDVLSPNGQGQLRRAIETQVIPRLMTAHQTDLGSGYDLQPGTTVATSFSYAEVEAFCDLLIRQPYAAADAYVEKLLDDGFPIEAVISSVLCSAARHLGLLWDSDRVTFVSVAVGLSRIQQLLRSFGPSFSANVKARGEGFNILLALVPGGGHSLGVSVVEEYFRHAGWQVDNLGSAPRHVLLDRVHDTWFDAVGLSAGGEMSNDEIAATIALLRDASANPRICVVVGGYHFTENPDLALTLGADFGARDPDQAIALLEQVPRMARIGA
jgi:MerR family transcriptional regulator, light-induced transcriptional regulator